MHSLYEKMKKIIEMHNSDIIILNDKHYFVELALLTSSVNRFSSKSIERANHWSS